MTKIYETSPLAGASTQELLRELLVRLGEDPDRDGLLRTPERMQKSLEYLTKGYQQDPDKVLQGALFDVNYDEMVIVKDIEMFSLCEHHILPFFGKVHVAYIPNGKGPWAQQDSPSGGYLCPPASGAGAPYGADR